MSTVIENLAQSVSSRFGEALVRIASRTGELTFEVPSSALVETCRVLRDDPALRFEQLIDLCGVDVPRLWSRRVDDRVGDAARLQPRRHAQ